MKEETKLPEVENNTDNIKSVQEGPNSTESKPTKRGRKKASEPPTEESKKEELPTEESKKEELPTEESKKEELPAEESKKEELPAEESKKEDLSVAIELSDEDNTEKTSNKRTRFLRYPVYIYMKKTKRSPILGSISGKVFELCKESTDEWICITCGISGVGKVTGFIYRKDAPII